MAGAAGGGGKADGAVSPTAGGGGGGGGGGSSVKVLGAWLHRVTKDYRTSRILEHKEMVKGQPTVQAFAHNMSRNRYRNIPLYDDTRVVLELLTEKEPKAVKPGKEGKPGKESKDVPYIHASWVGRDKAHPLVITQGPLPKTIAPASDGTVRELWRLVH